MMYPTHLLGRPSDADAVVAGVSDVTSANAPVASYDRAPRSSRTSSGADGGRREIFGSFWINGVEFALPVECIQDVVNAPDSYTPIPLSPAHMIGVFHLRGIVAPAIDLRVFFGYSEMEPEKRRKVAIIKHEDHLYGLLFDDTGNVVHSDGASRIIFENDADRGGDSIVSGMISLDNGKRLIQLLDPGRILNAQRLPKIASNQAEDEARLKLGTRRNCIAFRVADTRCALELKHVQEVMDAPGEVDTVMANGQMLGTIDLRGRMVPMIDFCGLLENRKGTHLSAEMASDRKLVILGLDDGQIALLVNAVESIVPYFEDEILPFDTVPVPRQKIVKGCLSSEDGEMIILFDFHKLNEDEELADAARSCRDIFAKDKDGKRIKAADDVLMSGDRRNFIVFSVGGYFAIDIAYVSEVHNLPEAMPTLPFNQKSVHGVYDLRGELIPVINMRKLYGMADTECSAAKVLVFQNDGKKYGLLVESIDEIVRTTQDCIFPYPTVSTEPIAKTIAEDVDECLNVQGSDMLDSPVLMLSIPALVQRCKDLEYSSYH